MSSCRFGLLFSVLANTGLLLAACVEDTHGLDLQPTGADASLSPDTGVAPSCEVCRPDTRRCTADEIERCVRTNDGCTSWLFEAACSDTERCEESEVRCTPREPDPCPLEPTVPIALDWNGVDGILAFRFETEAGTATSFVSLDAEGRQGVWQRETASILPNVDRVFLGAVREWRFVLWPDELHLGMVAEISPTAQLEMPSVVSPPVERPDLLHLEAVQVTPLGFLIVAATGPERDSERVVLARGPGYPDTAIWPVAISAQTVTPWFAAELTEEWVIASWLSPERRQYVGSLSLSGEPIGTPWELGSWSTESLERAQLVGVVRMGNDQFTIVGLEGVGGSRRLSLSLRNGNQSWTPVDGVPLRPSEPPSAGPPRIELLGTRGDNVVVASYGPSREPDEFQVEIVQLRLTFEVVSRFELPQTASVVAMAGGRLLSCRPGTRTPSGVRCHVDVLP